MIWSLLAVTVAKYVRSQAKHLEARINRFEVRKLVSKVYQTGSFQEMPESFDFIFLKSYSSRDLISLFRNPNFSEDQATFIVRFVDRHVVVTQVNQQGQINPIFLNNSKLNSMLLDLSLLALGFQTLNQTIFNSTKHW